MNDLQSYLHQHIPLSASIGVTVARSTKHSLTLTAPLEPNINHRETVFGGSACAVAILTAWSLIHIQIKKHPQINPRIVIQRNSIHYLKPIISDFHATCSLPEVEAWNRFIKGVERKGRGRVELDCILSCDGDKVGYFTGQYVVFDMSRA